METVYLGNGVKLVKCKPLNWVANSTYAGGTGPEYYSISVGSIGTMYNCTYEPEELRLTISNMSYSSDEVFKFKVTSFEEGSKLVQSFADGMEIDMSNTIFKLK